MATQSSQLEIVFADFDPLVGAVAECAFAAVLEAHPGAPVRVQVVQGNMLAAVAAGQHMQANGYDDYLTDLGYSQDQKDKFFGMGSGRCREPVLRWDSHAGPILAPVCVTNDNVAAGSSGSSGSTSGPSCSDFTGHIYSPPADDARTFLVYGANSAGVACGNAQVSVSQTFPIQFEEIHEQILREQHPNMEDDFWPLDTQGRIYASSSEPRDDCGVTGVSLLAAVVFPRAHNEHGNTRDVFCNALRAAMSSGRHAKGGKHERIVRVVTHALGTFTGHLDPPQFARSMAEGLDQYLTNAIIT